jgi:D-3-phosphoglycerate dehydrogenase
VPRVLITEELSDRGVDLLRAEFDVDVRPELVTEGLADAIGSYDALIVRSQTKVTFWSGASR